MSYSSAKLSFKTALQAVTWAIPTTALEIPNATATGFRRIDTQQFAEEVPMEQFPLVRIHIPDRPEHRLTDGGDLGSYKQRMYTVHLWMYFATWARYWQGGGDYFDAIIDATTAYFSHHGSPNPPGVMLPNDNIVAWGLRQAARVELPDLIDDALHFRATIGVEVNEFAT